MFTTVRRLLEMIRFSHTVFALPFALLAAVIAWRTPTPDGPPPAFSWRHLLGLLICLVGARSAAMAFNRLADRAIDAENPRTKMRHLPAGTLSVTTVTIFTLVSAAIFFAGTAFFLPNRLPLILALPVLLFLCGYSYTKRFTSLAHFWLGAALMAAPVCAWIAIRGEVVTRTGSDIYPAWFLGSAVLFWVAGFDIIYACQDFEFDREARLRSIPTALGVPGALRLAAVCHAATVVLLGAIPIVCPQVPLGLLYFAALAAVAALLVYEHRLVRPDDLTRVNTAFFNVNAIISLGLFVAGTIDLLT